MEQLRKELEEMLEKIYSNERALKFVHGFVKACIKRYGVKEQEG